MCKRIATSLGMVILAGLALLGCKDQMVGAPCVPETDKGEFNTEATGITWSIETRSVQCETRICLTKTDADTITAPADQVAACQSDASVEDCWGDSPVQFKFSFCSCRCKDRDGHAYGKNSDKYDDLCECPPNTECEEVLGDVEGAPEKIMGSYCVPRCIATSCEAGKICTPSKDSEKPWEWSCKELED